MKLGKMSAKLTRRKMLQGIAAATTAAVLSGCSSGDEDDRFAVMEVPQNDLSFDRAEKIVLSSGAFNCGSRCHHKLHVKNGRVIALTSAGDIPREGCQAYDENTGAELGEDKQVQYRACARGYTYIQKIYQPDRLKYPLIQTARKADGSVDRGNINGFKRVSWEVALDMASDYFKQAYDRAEILGYVPAVGRQWLYFNMMSRFGPMMGGSPYPCLAFHNNESTGNAEAAKFEAVGSDAQANNRTDRFNSKFILTWGQDNSSTTYYQSNAFWMETKIRESENNVPIVVISSTYSDAAAMLATGVEVIYPDFNAPSVTKSVSVPGWVACRPATDGALMVAMMYVIYKRNLYDEDFLRNKCFGFFTDQEIESSAPESTDPASVYKGMNRGGNPVVFPKAYTFSANRTFNFKDSYQGAVFKADANDSFEGYLLSRETEWGSGPGDYDGVLAYVGRLTGVKPDIAEALAIQFSKWAKLTSWADPTKPEAALLEAGGGPQRSFNGMEWVWLCICLNAMCGYSDRPGGSPGFSMYAMTDDMVYSDTASFDRGAGAVDSYGGTAIQINLSALGEILMKGTDWRSPERLIDDVLLHTNGQLNLTGREKLIEIDLVVVDFANYIVSQANSNKLIKAFKENLKHLIVADQHMTPTAALADIIFPISSHFEDTSYGDATIVGPSARFIHARAIDRMYDTWPEEDFQRELWNAANAKTGMQFPPIIPLAQRNQEEFYSAIEPSKYYKSFVDGNAQMPTWEELVNHKGFSDLTIPKDKPIIGMRDITIPSDTYNAETYLDNSTGRINFFSPMWKLRMSDYTGADLANQVGCRSATAKYIPNREGYEKFFSDAQLTDFTGYHSADSGRTYKLLYLANKPRYRAQTVFDNVAMMKDQVRHHGVRMNVKDAEDRRIKDGDLVYVYNDRGVIRVRAEVSNRLPPGVVSVEHGVWHRPSKLENAHVWIRHHDGTVDKVSMPVDIGGCANTLTDDCFTLDPVYLNQTLAAQGGPCEINLVHPDRQ